MLDKSQVKTLLDAGVSIDFSVRPAPLESGYHLTLSINGEFPKVFCTAKNQIRIFKSLESVYSLVASEWDKPFTVFSK